VLIDVEDECGGLPPGKAEDLFRPFEQRGADKSGLGLGLSISMKGVRANGGEIRVRNLPGKGCTFTVDLPRASTDGALILDVAKFRHRSARRSRGLSLDISLTLPLCACVSPFITRFAPFK
jgi:hypothetical protein